MVKSQHECNVTFCFFQFMAAVKMALCQLWGQIIRVAQVSQLFFFKDIPILCRKQF